jgi:hypothetical protein
MPNSFLFETMNRTPAFAGAMRDEGLLPSFRA